VLRIATTIQHWTWWGRPIPIDIVVDQVGDDDNLSVVSDPSTGTSDGSSGGADATISSGASTSSSSAMSPNTASTSSDSTTENYLITLELPGLNGTEPGVIQELGRLQLGKPNETFTAVRFFDDVAYAVTFERRDPLYVIDLSDNSNPTIRGELEISGFSSYLHPMNADNTLLLAIGEETDENGTTIGIQLSVFNAVDPFNPYAAVRYVIENEKDAWSYTNSEWDFKSTRYAGERLIIPVDIYKWNDTTQMDEGFHGFVTYFVNATLIEKECEIANGQDVTPSGQMPTDVCYYCAYFPSRSMIFDGNLMTMSNHFVRYNDMNTCASIWDLNIAIPSDDRFGCCGPYIY
jgi:hypothetical protein